MSHTEASSAFQYSFLDDGREVGRFGPLDKIPNVAHAVTTKNGPLFSANVDADTMGFEVLAHKIGCKHAAWCRQVHSNDVLVVDKPGCAEEADGLVTNTPGLAVLGRSADCPLILAADRSGQVVGFAHASWRATLGKIAEKLINTMVNNFSLDPAEIVACISPSAGPDRYEVGEEILTYATESLGPDAKYFFIRRDGKLFFDLWSANVNQLQSAGVGFMNLYTARVCTIEQNDRFPSYRAEGQAAKRFVGIIGKTE